MRTTAYGRRAVTAFGVAAAGAVSLCALALLASWEVATNLRRTVDAQEATLIAAAERQSTGVEAATDGLEGALFPGTSAADLQAELQSTVQAVATEHQFAVTSLQMLKLDRAAGLSRQTMRLEGTIPESQLAGLLDAFATHRPLLIVRDAALRPAVQFANRLPIGQPGERQLAVQFDVAAFAPASQGGR